MKYSLQDLERFANEMRIDIIKMLHEAGSGHPGGSLSCIDAVTSIMYNYVGRTAQNAADPDRHRFVMSKGHGVPALYAVLARMGIVAQDELMTLRKINSRLQGHPVVTALPEVEFSTGSLGQGLSVAQGMAMAAKLDGKPLKIYCMIGDGELQEGQIWESLMSAPKFMLDNLIVLLDYNKGQIDGPTREVMDIEPVDEKLRAFNWDVQVIDGHDFKQLDEALTKAQNTGGKPHFIVAHTVKGKGVSFMEGVIDWHGKAPNDEQTVDALKELEARVNAAAEVAQ
ncbi:MAG: transketolase [Ectothiorhodospiraceae bacterium]|nr:transketolase [Ectothiorhodospiraceae bacterium]